MGRRLSITRAFGRIWRWTRDALAAGGNIDYALYRDRCARRHIPPLSYREFAKLFGGPELYPWHRKRGPSGYDSYRSRCKKCGDEPLSYEEYCRAKRKADPLPRRCPDCNYDLTGNVSGRCPECGRYLQ